MFSPFLGAISDSTSNNQFIVLIVPALLLTLSHGRVCNIHVAIYKESFNTPVNAGYNTSTSTISHCIIFGTLCAFFCSSQRSLPTYGGPLGVGRGRTVLLVYGRMDDLCTGNRHLKGSTQCGVLYAGDIKPVPRGYTCLQVSFCHYFYCMQLLASYPAFPRLRFSSLTVFLDFLYCKR